jgi:S-DNA-T family DNA segregation ATPase FtsK/SpoIIIE
VQYRLPGIELLNAPPIGSREPDERRLKLTATLLTQKLAGFKIKGSCDATTPGPLVTTYEFAPMPGTKISKIAALEAELSMALSLSEGLRVIAPLPGTDRVGIEVPHAEADREIVFLRELLEDERWQSFCATAALPIALGKDSRGEPVYCDLERMPHLLVAGATDQGKSVGLSSVFTSLLMARTPDQVRVVAIDPKVVELALFADIPHLLVPIVTEPREAISALRWAVEEMERRYQLLAEAKVKNLRAYNDQAGRAAMARVIVMVDELADLFAVDRKEGYVEAAIARLAAKARAAGIHLILATQRPSVSIVDGDVKANMSRIAFRVRSSTDSQVILGPGVTGAEQLLGRGDMLCQLPGSLVLRRVHGAYVDDKDIRGVCDCLREQGAPAYDDSVLATPAAGSPESEESRPELFERAVELVVAAGGCSTSAVQRQLNIGYNAAAKLVERMEKERLVGPAVSGGRKREVLVDAAP